MAAIRGAGTLSTLSVTILAVVCVAGCETGKSPPVKRGAPPIEVETGPAPERDPLGDLKKDVAPPTVIKPDQPPSPATKTPGPE